MDIVKALAADLGIAPHFVDYDRAADVADAAGADAWEFSTTFLP